MRGAHTLTSLWIISKKKHANMSCSFNSGRASASSIGKLFCNQEEVPVGRRRIQL